LGADSTLERYVGRLLADGRGRTSLEVGAFPGSHLLWLALDHGYRPTALDTRPEVLALPRLFAERGVEVTAIQADFLEWSPPEPFDLVCSFGVVEHFEDFSGVIRRHWDWVKPGGYLLLTIPAWSPVQAGLRRLIYTRSRWREVCTAHNLSAMNLRRLRSAVAACPGCRLMLARYTREMTFWVRTDQSGVRPWSRPLFLPIRALEFVLGRLHLSHPWFSPEVLALARKDDLD